MKNDPTEEQLQTLRAGLRGHRLEALMVIAMTTGMRRDELHRLTWPEVDLEKGEMHVWNSKTRQRSRVIHLPQESVSLLRQQALRQREPSVEAARGKRPLDLVFPDETGGEFSSSRFVAEWNALLEEVGFPGLRFHALRLRVWRQLHEHAANAQEGEKDTYEENPPFSKSNESKEDTKSPYLSTISWDASQESRYRWQFWGSVPQVYERVHKCGGQVRLFRGPIHHSSERGSNTEKAKGSFRCKIVLPSIMPGLRSEVASLV